MERERAREREAGGGGGQVVCWGGENRKRAPNARCSVYIQRALSRLRQRISAKHKSDTPCFQP